MRLARESTPGSILLALFSMMALSARQSTDECRREASAS